jgi:hypothetical protein
MNAKYSPLLWILFIGLSVPIAAVAAPDKQDLPNYVLEFASKMGLNTCGFDRIHVNIQINREAEHIGFSNVERIARGSKDEFTGCPYFKIRTIPEGIVIEKNYTLENDFRELKLYLTRGKDGEFASATFAESVR